jgi:HEAT repeat protein
MRSTKKTRTGLVMVTLCALGPMQIAAQHMGTEARVALEEATARIALARPALAEAPMGLALAQARMAEGAPAVAATAATLALARTSLATSRFSGPVFAASPPEPWIQEDPASRLYQAAREALNRRRYEEAAETFAEIRDRYPRSGYVPDSYYWQAFALYRQGGRSNLRLATELLHAQGDEYPDAATGSDADALVVRIEAQLARRGDADAAEAIAREAAGPCDEEQEVRLAALSALLNMNADQAVPILQEVLQSRDECSVELRRRAVFLISQKMTDESVDILLDLAHRNPDPDPEVREQAVFWLHQVQTPEALDALESILIESEDSELQERAIFAISQRSDARSVEILKNYAERSDVPRELRENAIFWISQNPRAGGAEYLIQLYPRLEDDELRERAIFGIAQTSSSEGRAFLLERVRDRSETVEVRKNALFWVGQMGGLEASDLQGLYESLDDVEMKEQVIFVASQMNDSEAVDFLMDVVRTEEDNELKEKALFWLGQSNDPRVAEFLLSLIRGEAVRR